jgi:hypothetical protein
MNGVECQESKTVRVHWLHGDVVWEDGDPVFVPNNKEWEQLWDELKAGPSEELSFIWSGKQKEWIRT